MEVASCNGYGEHDLVERAQRGDPAAFEEIDALYRKQIYGLCLRMMQNVADAEDLTQEVFLRVFQKVHEFRADSKFITWIYRIAINFTFMKLRGKGRKCHVSMDELIETDEATFLRQITAHDRHLALTVDRMALDRAFRQLRPIHRTVIYLCDVEGYTHAEVVVMLGISIPALKARLHQARKKMCLLLSTKADSAASGKSTKGP